MKKYIIKNYKGNLLESIDRFVKNHSDLRLVEAKECDGQLRLIADLKEGEGGAQTQAASSSDFFAKYVLGYLKQLKYDQTANLFENWWKWCVGICYGDYEEDYESVERRQELIGNALGLTTDLYDIARHFRNPELMDDIDDPDRYYYELCTALEDYMERLEEYENAPERTDLETTEPEFKAVVEAMQPFESALIVYLCEHFKGTKDAETFAPKEFLDKVIESGVLDWDAKINPIEIYLEYGCNLDDRFKNVSIKNISNEEDLANMINDFSASCGLDQLIEMSKSNDEQKLEESDLSRDEKLKEYNKKWQKFYEENKQHIKCRECGEEYDAVPSGCLDKGYPNNLYICPGCGALTEGPEVTAKPPEFPKIEINESKNDKKFSLPELNEYYDQLDGIKSHCEQLMLYLEKADIAKNKSERTADDQGNIDIFNSLQNVFVPHCEKVIKFIKNNENELEFK